ncbi:hypothetical protein IEQ34_009913 [Dendrobium chrysotoxum]|uniref:Uncharacterized protein n=1 Tax=Dendrobium chrysotoxum TaxID=161865 RepID=A0AAV7H488_DENCH|nr:hypothetical protein IEQ34_009913 [Dendrobium chrysotoxum]
MAKFPSFYGVCKSLGHSKADCYVLHRHLNDVPVNIPSSLTNADIATTKLILKGCSTAIPYNTAIDNFKNHSLINVSDVVDSSDDAINLANEDNMNVLDVIHATTVISNN